MSAVVWSPNEPPPQTMSSHGARKYTGETADNYDAKRESSPKWLAENDIVRGYLDDLPEGAWVLDCPVGTGRFLEFYHDCKFQVFGYDVSDAMLVKSLEKVEKFEHPERIRLIRGDVRELDKNDKSVDVSLMIRLTRWLSPEDRARALLELQRVTRKRIIFTARVADHPHMFPYDDTHVVPPAGPEYTMPGIKSCLDGWEITRDEPAGEENYRVIMLEPVE